MTTSLVLTFIGHDRPGLVNAISEKIAAAGGSWLESRLAHLAGEFAGIVLVSVANPQLSELLTQLRGLEAAGLQVTVAPSAPAAAQSRALRMMQLQLVGHERPGIVRDVTQALSGLGVNIESFGSRIESAPFTGETMFRAEARLLLPEEVTASQIQRTVELLADEIMVDLTIAPEASA